MGYRVFSGKGDAEALIGDDLESAAQDARARADALHARSRATSTTSGRSRASTPDGPVALEGRAGTCDRDRSSVGKEPHIEIVLRRRGAASRASRSRSARVAACGGGGCRDGDRDAEDAAPSGRRRARAAAGDAVGRPIAPRRAASSRCASRSPTRTSRTSFARTSARSSARTSRRSSQLLAQDASSARAAGKHTAAAHRTLADEDQELRVPAARRASRSRASRRSSGTPTRRSARSGAPARPPEMRPGDLYVRVPIATPRVGSRAALRRRAGAAPAPRRRPAEDRRPGRRERHLTPRSVDCGTALEIDVVALQPAVHLHALFAELAADRGDVARDGAARSARSSSSVGRPRRGGRSGRGAPRAARADRAPARAEARRGRLRRRTRRIALRRSP